MMLSMIAKPSCRSSNTVATWWQEIAKYGTIYIPIWCIASYLNDEVMSTNV